MPVLQGEPDASTGDFSRENDASEHVETPDETPRPTRGGPTGDVIELALADALNRATQDGDYSAIREITAELKARRESRAPVVSIETARARRDGKA